MGLLVCGVGCGPRYYIPSYKSLPGIIVVSAYTQDGCKDELKEEARTRGLEVSLKDIKPDWGWEILLWPLYKGYQCAGEVVGPANPAGSM